MIFKLQYQEDVIRKDIPKLSSKAKKQIKKAIEEKLTYKPETFGKPLRRSKKGYRSLRIGNYRVIFRIENKLIKIFAIGHRSIVYEENQQRF